MRRLIIEEWISLDGHVSDKDGRLEFFRSTVREINAEPVQIKFLESIDCILLGRRTYEQFATLWPQRPIEKEVLARIINQERKIVFSNTLKKAPWGNWADAEIASGDPIEAVKHLKSLPGKNIVLWGSISLAQLLLEENVVDELRLHICPAITGGGRKFFSEETDAKTLKLLEVSRQQSGLISTIYS